MSGYHTPFTPGWDCHGLPIELQVEKNMGKENLKIIQMLLLLPVENLQENK